MDVGIINVTFEISREYVRYNGWDDPIWYLQDCLNSEAEYHNLRGPWRVLWMWYKYNENMFLHCFSVCLQGRRLLALPAPASGHGKG